VFARDEIPITSLPRLIVGEEFRLLRGDTFPVQIRDPALPFLDQLRCLPATSFGTCQHPFCVRSQPSLGVGTVFHVRDPKPNSAWLPAS
jgi:hypothetical protein